MQAAIAYLSQHYNEDISLAVVSLALGISPSYLSTLFKQEMDLPFVDYVNQIRVEKSCLFLKDPSYKTYEIAYKVGLKDEKYF